LEFFYYEHSFLIFVLHFIMYLTFAILCVFYVYFMCAAIGVIINDDDDYFFPPSLWLPPHFPAAEHIAN